MNLLEHAMEIKDNGLQLVILGASGSGKSHAIGTYPGKVAYLYGSGESHGPKSARKEGTIIPLSWDKSKDGMVIPIDRRLKRIIDFLDPEGLKEAKVNAVALDSITMLVNDLKQTDAFKKRCLTSKGTHNAFKETEALIELVSIVLNKLQDLSESHGIDVICTIDLNIQSVDETGIITESRPGLPTFGVAKAIIQQFADILVLGRIEGKPVFQNFAQVKSASKDFETNTTVKYIEYHPRLQGVIEVPELIPANLKEILKLKGR